MRRTLSRHDNFTPMTSTAINHPAPLTPEVYDRLRRMAAAWLAHERPDHTHQPTSLANEAYLRLAPHLRADADLLPLAAHVMRQVLVDHARRHNARKRSGTRKRTPVPDLPAPNAPAIDVLIIHEALDDLERLDPQLARVVELRFFGGLSEAETAAHLGVSTRTISRSWRVARLFLSRRLDEADR
jgi:RNA polymerase sigma factor (TIGR02999 family)